MDKLTFGEKIRQLREAKDASLREIAASIKVSAAFLSDVELGRRFPSEDTLVLLAGKLGVEADELRKYDFREEAENIRKMMFSDPDAGMAFRTVAERIKGGLTHAEIVKKLSRP